MVVLQCCVWLLAEMPSTRAAFDLNNRKSGVNRHLRFCTFPTNSEMCRVWVRIIHLTMAPTRHISELKYALKYHNEYQWGKTRQVRLIQQRRHRGAPLTNLHCCAFYKCTIHQSSVLRIPRVLRQSSLLRLLQVLHPSSL